MTTSSKCLDLIKRFEGCKLEAYRDQGGVLTIGYGHTGTDVHGGQLISQVEADALFAVDVARFAQGVQRLITVPVQQYQFDALVSFAFNLGLVALSGSTLLKLLNYGDYNAAADEFVKWDHVGGIEVAGLLRRRESEQAMFQGRQG
jgi:lysozyme